MQHPNIVEFEVYGPYALFADPLMRVGGEKSSYQVPTYEALKGVLSSIYWKHAIIWYIDEVRIMNRIQTEVKSIPCLSSGRTTMKSASCSTGMFITPVNMTCWKKSADILLSPTLRDTMPGGTFSMSAA